MSRKKVKIKWMQEKEGMDRWDTWANIHDTFLFQNPEEVWFANRFYVAMCLSGNRSQMTSNCNDKQKKNWHTRCSQVCYWCSYHFWMSSVIHYWTDPQQLRINLFMWYRSRRTVNNDIINVFVCKNQSKGLNDSAYYFKRAVITRV